MTALLSYARSLAEKIDCQGNEGDVFKQLRDGLTTPTFSSGLKDIREPGLKHVTMNVVKRGNALLDEIPATTAGQFMTSSNSTYCDSPWGEGYVRRKCYLTDPTVLRVLASNVAFYWSGLPLDQYTFLHTDFLGASRAEDIHDGYTFGVRHGETVVLFAVCPKAAKDREDARPWVSPELANFLRYVACFTQLKLEQLAGRAEDSLVFDGPRGGRTRIYIDGRAEPFRPQRPRLVPVRQ